MKIAFYKANGKFLDRLIRWWTSGKYSHCELVFADGLSYSADAWQGKVRYEKINFNPEHWDTVELDLTAKEELLVRAWCDSQEGKGYDWLGIALAQIIPISVEDPNKWFCSELLVAALQRVGRLQGFKPSEIDPSELAILYDLM